MGGLMKRREIPREEDIAELRDDKEEDIKPSPRASKEQFRVVEVPTQTDLIVRDVKSGDNYNALQMLAMIKNDLEEIKRSL